MSIYRARLRNTLWL